jgi:hypothetical protein
MHKEGRHAPTLCWFSLIRTLTVGLRVSLSQPIPGGYRVADFNRRFEITSTPKTTSQVYLALPYAPNGNFALTTPIHSKNLDQIGGAEQP